MANKQTVAGTVMGTGVTSFAQPVVDRDGRVYTDKGQATDWLFLEWPDKISPKSLPAAMQVVDGTVRGVLGGANVVLTTRNGAYILQVQHEGLEVEIGVGEEISRLVVAEQASPRGRDDWQRDFTTRLQGMLKEANK
jgi:hypothetical protein